LIVKGVFFGHFESIVRGVLKAPFWLFEDFEKIRGDFLWSLNCKKETRVLEVDGKLDFERRISQVLHDKGPCIVFHFFLGLKLLSRHPNTDHGRRVLIEFRVELVDKQEPSLLGSGVGQTQVAIIVFVLKGQNFFVDFVCSEFGRDQLDRLYQELGVRVVHDSIDQERIVGYRLVDQKETEVFVEDFLDWVQGGKRVV
jgi:hypothetical protein